MSAQLLTLKGPAGELPAPVLWMKHGLAVHRAWGESGYALTHCRTGTKLATFPRKSDAVECGLKVMHLASWRLQAPTAELNDGVKAQIAALIVACGGAR